MYYHKADGGVGKEECYWVFKSHRRRNEIPKTEVMLTQAEKIWRVKGIEKKHKNSRVFFISVE